MELNGSGIFYIAAGTEWNWNIIAAIIAAVNGTGIAAVNGIEWNWNIYICSCKSYTMLKKNMIS